MQRVTNIILGIAIAWTLIFLAYGVCEILNPKNELQATSAPVEHEKCESEDYCRIK